MFRYSDSPSGDESEDPKDLKSDPGRAQSGGAAPMAARTLAREPSVCAMPDRKAKTRPTNTKSLGTFTTGSSRIASNSSSVISSVNSPSKAPVSLRDSMRRDQQERVGVAGLGLEAELLEGAHHRRLVQRHHREHQLEEPEPVALGQLLREPEV